MNSAPSRENRSWPAYILGGRLRTTTVALVIAFCAIWWLYETYQPAPEPPPQVPASEVVPPGFIPDPNYTWAPRTNVQPATPVTTTPTTTPTTPTTTPATPATTPSTPTASPTTGPSSAAPTPTTSASPTTSGAPPEPSIPAPAPPPPGAPAEPSGTPQAAAGSREPAAIAPVPAGDGVAAPALPAR